MKHLRPQAAIGLLLLLGSTMPAGAQKLYSTAPNGNAVFSFDTGTNTVSQLGQFSSVNINQPKGELVHMGNGEFIGLTEYSPNLYGAIYKTDTSSNTVTVLYQFTNNDKAQSGLVLAGNGKLYCLGNTGTSNESRIYSFDPASNTYSNEYEIPGNAGGAALGGMIRASNGILYGVTHRGGANDKGRIFSFNTATAAFTTLFDFNTADGTLPDAHMIQASNGKLYGVTSYGGANDKGVIYSFDIATSAYTKLYDFVQSTGECPTSPLYQASDGKLYGTTMSGGSYYQGVLYSFDIGTGVYSDLHDFFASDGYGPRCYPVELANGVLYGTTNQGGANFYGSIYSYHTGTAAFTKLYDGNTGTAGNFTSPFFSFASVAQGIVERTGSESALTIFPNPASDRIRVANTWGNCSYRISDCLGRAIETGSLDGGTVSISHLAPGIYALQIINTTGEIKASCFVKE